MTGTTQKYGIVGAGRLGLSLAAALRSDIQWVVNRSEQGRRPAREMLPDVGVFRTVEEIAAPPAQLILAVADSAIQPLAEQCARHWGRALDGTTVLHCSGALGRDALEACRRMGACTLAAHPYQTIAFPSADVFRDVAWGVEAGPDDRDEARLFVERLGGTAFFFSDEQLALKALYHASAVMAANYLTVLTTCAAGTAAAAGVPAELFLPTIMRTALENSLSALTSKNRNFPLTGPIARGDTATITRHIQQLRPHPHLLRAYCLFGCAAVDQAAQRGVIDDDMRQRLFALLFAELGDNDDIPYSV